MGTLNLTKTSRRVRKLLADKKRTEMEQYILSMLQEEINKKRGLKFGQIIDIINKRLDIIAHIHPQEKHLWKTAAHMAINKIEFSIACFSLQNE